jgi:hypothetical protein
MKRALIVFIIIYAGLWAASFADDSILRRDLVIELEDGLETDAQLTYPNKRGVRETRPGS